MSKVAWLVGVDAFEKGVLHVLLEKKKKKKEKIFLALFSSLIPFDRLSSLLNINSN